MISLKTILLIEDNLRDAELVQYALTSRNLANPIVHLRDGEEALDYLFRRGPFADRTNAQPAFVLLDLKMPKVDGFEVLRQMRAEPALKTLPVVVMTSSCEERELAAGYDLGINGYVVKPVTFSDFVDAVTLIGRFWAVLNEPPPAWSGPP